VDDVLAVKVFNSLNDLLHDSCSIVFGKRALFTNPVEQFASWSTINNKKVSKRALGEKWSRCYLIPGGFWPRTKSEEAGRQTSRCSHGGRCVLTGQRPGSTCRDSRT
jgi:hypothetical protein